MNFRHAAWLCLIGATACSHNNPEPVNSADDVNQPYMATSEPAMTPASRETARSVEDTTATAPASSQPSSANSADAPAIADARATSPADSKNATPRSNTPNQPGAAQPDNTKVNERDTSSAALTPPDQRENETDLKITQHVRQAVMADGSLSFTAKNVKIIAQGGKVTLRGPVKTSQERDAIEAAARKVAGVTQVDNQIEVKK